MVALILSGATAIPLESEMKLLLWILHRFSITSGAIHDWLSRVYSALADTNARYPFISYGFDWLAFGHFVIAITFVGVLRDPIRNRWVLQFGMIAAALVIPYALVLGQFRGIPIFWRLIDCSFGVFAFPLLWYAYRASIRLEQLTKQA
jgi:hypothetical protein